MKKTALLEKLGHGQRARGAGHAGYSMEFSDLLDEIEPEPVPLPRPAVRAETDLSLADLVMFPVPQLLVAEPEPVVTLVEAACDETINDTAEQKIEAILAAPAKVSRFAAGGIDDDLLPARAPRRRLRR